MTSRLIPACLLFVFISPSARAVAKVHEVQPGDDPQAIIEAASPGDKLLFLPGIHELPLNKHQSMLYVDKPIDIELQEACVLRLANKQTQLQLEPELTIDHGAKKTLDDFSSGGRYDGGLGPVIFTVKIDGQGVDGRPDTFAWVHGWGPGATQGSVQNGVPINGDWQPLSHGVEIKFDNKHGHSVGSFWALSYDGPASYGIRVGHGTQPNIIENVRIYGRGTIDMNRDNNVQPSELVKDISASVLIHGRVRNVSIEQITMTNTFRSVMVYGEHTGEFLDGGGTRGGESFDAENIAIIGTRTLNPNGKAYLLGHPSHRGRLTNVRCNYNYMETHGTAIEPNFNLSQYEVIGNVIKSSGRAIHCWRKSTDGVIKNNVRLEDTTGKVARPPEHQMEVVMVNSPGAWEDPENLILRDNRNYLTDGVGFWATATGGFENQATGRFAAIGGGERNRASGVGSAIAGGIDNVAEAAYSTASGYQASAHRPAENSLAAGAFETPGDAQASRLVAKCLTTDEAPKPLLLATGDLLKLSPGSTVAYRILVAARSQDGQLQAAYEAKGLAGCNRDGELTLKSPTVSTIHESQAALNFQVLAAKRSPALKETNRGFKSQNSSSQLTLQAQGIANTNIRWVAQIELVEVHF